MLTLKTSQIGALTLLLGLTTLNPVLAQPYPIYGDQANDYDYRAGVIDVGTRIWVTHDDNRLTLEPGEMIPLTLTVTSPVRDRSGTVIIPNGSQIEGQLEPVSGGVRFVARSMKIDDYNWIPLDATSDVVGEVESATRGATTGTIIKGTLSGAGAGAIIAGTTGDRRIDALEVLAGAAVGTLAGWGLPASGVVGGGTKEVITLNPSRDLTLTVQSPLSIGNYVRPVYDNYPNRDPQTRPTSDRRPNPPIW